MNQYFLAFIIFFSVTTAFSQRVEIKLGPDEISQNEYWTVSITAYNTELKSYEKFPEITGFRKGQPSTRNSTSYVNGTMSSTQSVIMNYAPIKPGVVTVPSISMKINNQLVKVQGKKVTIRPGSQNAQRPGYKRTPDNIFDNEETEYIDIKENAFLGLTTDKKEVYVGEGVAATLAFYMAEDNRAPLQFYDISRQLTEILKKLKPVNCWEENFDIENIEGQRVILNGKEYVQWKIYEAVFFPLNTETINFPSVGLEMLKPKVARNPSFFSPNTQEAYKVFKSKAVSVRVKDLPPHPLKKTVAVGEFRLEERLAGTDLQTGQSTAYQFNIHGTGNIASLERPATKTDNFFEIYEPAVSQEINRKNNKVTGAKSFRYFMIPKEPGQYKLAPYFQWVYFSPSRERYDTLHSNLTVFVKGESKRNEVIESFDPGSFYDRMTSTDNTLRAPRNTAWHQWAFNGFLLVIVGASAFLLFRK